MAIWFYVLLRDVLKVSLLKQLQTGRVNSFSLLATALLFPAITLIDLAAIVVVLGVAIGLGLLLYYGRKAIIAADSDLDNS